jgi:CHAT domain-containing protein/tetratricopeptide (TPR) repeat protein
MTLPPAAALVLATALASGAPIPPGGGRETFSLEPMQSRRHQIALQAGQFLQATVHQLDIDVVLRLLGPDGTVLEARFDSSEGPVGMEPASLQATVSGVYAIEVHAPEDVEGPGRYELESQPPRQPDARDLKRREAERLMEVGGRFMGPRAGGRRRNRPGYEQVVGAQRAYRDVLPFWQELGETCWEAEARSCFALNQMWSSEEASIDNFVRSLDLWQACGDDGYKFIETVLYTGRAMERWSRLREAAETLELGLGLARTRKDQVLASHFLGTLSSVYGQLGDQTRAIETGEESLALVRALGHKPRAAVALTNLAQAHYRRGALQKASDLALQALELRREIGEELGLQTTLTTLAEIYQALGEPEVALSYLDEASAVVAQLGPGTAAYSSVSAANVLRGIGKPAEARARLLRDLELRRNSVQPRVELRARLALAALFLDEGDASGARPHVDRTLEVEGTIGDPLVRADALDLRGRIDLMAGELLAADEALAQSLAIRRQVGDRLGEAGTLFLHAEVSRAAGNLEETRRRLEEARAVVAAQRAVFMSPNLRATWGSTVREIEAAYVAVLMEQHARAPDRALDALAFEASDAASARSLLDMLGERGEPAAGTTAGRERAARERLTGALDRQMRARAGGASPSAEAALEQEVRDLSSEYERLASELRANDSRPRQGSEPLRLAAIQQNLLDDETTLLEFFLGTERGYAWVVTRGRIHSYELPARARIDAAVDAVRSALAAPPRPSGGRQRAADALRQLAGMVLPRDRSVLRGSRLVVVADGSLHYVPFAALPDISGDPLLVRFEIANAPSASVAAELRRELSGRTPAPLAIAALADPVFDADDARLPGPQARPEPDTTLQRATRDFGFRNGRLPRLPFSRREAAALVALAPVSSTARLDFDANLDAAQSSDLASYRFLHFATHGLLNDTRPELSGLVLSLVDGKGRPRPGLLTAPDVSNLRLGAELVVLSSCRSAMGREVRGEGLMGLTRAFMQAGAPRVVASLWPVDDLASSELMTRMYGGLLGSRKLAPAAALRDAQLALFRHRRWSAPYYWAAFQLQGEWR